ncbi:hypothetical protein [Stutzerimonas tarimensis]|uniref:D-alanyl-lipoteichoic acid biosynthesis protein DltD n=1 Tax=Stutzerimonas tarimensis TaxID=1507735 RepID=A0ABV7T956_9GAMM
MSVVERTSSPDEGTSSSRIGGHYLLAMAGGLLGALVLFAGVLLTLERTDHLPPPAFSNSLCVDEKLGFLRSHRLDDPDLLVIGSSVAWRHFDGAAVVEASPGTRPLNGAFCGLHANQSAYAAHWLLDREPGIRQVVMIADPQDFTGCWRVREAVFDRDDADRYVYGEASSWPYYLRYFAPVSLVRNALGIQDQRTARNEWDPLVFDRFGDGPLDTPNSRGLLYGRPEPLDPVCFDALRALAERLHHQGIGFTLVSTPLHPDWKARHDPQRQLLDRFDRQLAQSLAGTDAHYWNADRDHGMPAAAFVDAIHLRWSAARLFSADLARALRAREAAMRDDATPPPAS